MGGYATTEEVAAPALARPLSKAQQQRELRWDLGFAGILFYMIIEYTRLAAMYPILQPLQLGKIAVALCAVGFVLSPKIRTISSPYTRRIDVAITLFVVSSFFSTLLARYQEEAWDGFIFILMWWVIYFLISRIVSNRWRVRVFLTFFLLLNFKLAQFVVRGFIAVKSQGFDEMVIVTHGVNAGSTGFFANSADLGVALSIALAIAGSLFFASNKRYVRIMLLACAVFYLAAILLCGSRGAVVGAAGVALASVARNPRKLAAPFLLLLLLIGVVLVLPEASKERFRSAWNWKDDPTANHRVLLWKSGLRMFPDHFVLGVGPHNYGLVRMNSYPDPRIRAIPSVAHSTYIEALTEYGSVGSACMLVLWWLFFQLNARTREHVLSLKLGRQSWQYCLAVGLDLALVGYLVSGAFVSVLLYPHVWILAALSVGLYQSCMQMPAQNGASEVTRVRPELAWITPGG